MTLSFARVRTDGDEEHIRKLRFGDIVISLVTWYFMLDREDVTPHDRGERAHKTAERSGLR